MVPNYSASDFRFGGQPQAATPGWGFPEPYGSMGSGGMPGMSGSSIGGVAMGMPSAINVGAQPIGVGSDLSRRIAAATGGTLPGVTAGGGGMFAGMSGMDKASLALGGLQTIGGLWSAFQAQKLAKKQFAYTKDVTETNLANQIQSYNTLLQDRSRSRAFVEGQTPEQAQQYIDANSLKRTRP